jgi:hypothetical protein
MIASSSYPVDSLRKPSFTNVYGVSATIMDYARQNYVAQPEDGLQPKDFVRRLGPFDDFVINWGYRALPQAATPEAERPILNDWVINQTGRFRYRYSAQFLSGIDPRSQTEDVGDDPTRASGLALRNMQRLIPQLVSWTTRPGEDYGDLAEIYTETLGMWALYMGHVTNVIGGVEVDAKVSEQPGAVYAPVGRARQKEALAFLSEQALRTPAWLAPSDILSRIGPQGGGGSLVVRQGNVVAALLDARRLDRLALGEQLLPAASAYPLPDYLGDVRRALLATPGVPLDANRRQLHRVYLERLEALLSPPPAPAAGGPFGGGGGGGQQLPGIVAPPNVRRADHSALARAELRAVRQAATASAVSATGVARAHWQDVADRVTEILEKQKGR